MNSAATTDATPASWADNQAASPPDGRKGLASASFLGLLATQFLGAMNDNIFRFLAVPIAKQLFAPLVGEESRAESLAVSLGLAGFVAPFLIWAATAGYLADRFSKRTVIVWCKIAEVILMLMAAGSIYLGNAYLLFLVVFLMGTHSALFGPSKLGSIPEIVRPDRISVANGLVGLTTVMAIVIGAVVGGQLYEIERKVALVPPFPPVRDHQRERFAVLVGTAGIGFSLVPEGSLDGERDQGLQHTVG